MLAVVAATVIRYQAMALGILQVLGVHQVKNKCFPTHLVFPAPMIFQYRIADFTWIFFTKQDLVAAQAGLT